MFFKFMYLICWNTKITFIKRKIIFKLKLCIVLVLFFFAKLLDLLDQSHYLWYIHLYVIEIWFKFMQFWTSFLFLFKLISIKSFLQMFFTLHVTKVSRFVLFKYLSYFYIKFILSCLTLKGAWFIKQNFPPKVKEWNFIFWLLLIELTSN